jgi:hypothetical protein
MKKHVIILLLAVFIFNVSAHSQADSQLTNEQKTWLSKANRHEKNGWIYLHIEGNPEERGFQHGYLLSKEIKEYIRILSEVWKYQTAMKWSWFIARAHDILTPKTDVICCALGCCLRNAIRCQKIS